MRGVLRSARQRILDGAREALERARRRARAEMRLQPVDGRFRGRSQLVGRGERSGTELVNDAVHDAGHGPSGSLERRRQSRRSPTDFCRSASRRAVSESMPRTERSRKRAMGAVLTA